MLKSINMEYSYLIELVKQNPILGLIILGVVCFLSATLLPFPSELFLIVYLKTFTQYKILAIVYASIFNTAGGLVSYIIGYTLKNQILKRNFNTKKIREKNKLKRLAYFYIKKYGSMCLVLSWLPIVGDFLCLAAGYFKLNVYICSIFMLIGKLLRYIIIACFIN